MVENLPVAHLEESEPNHHVVRVGWSVDSTSYQLGNSLNFGNPPTFSHPNVY